MPVQASAKDSALEASVARIDADIVALKASLEHTSKTATSQFNKTSDRLDKVEKAQAEPAAKLAKLSEAVDKLRAAPRRPRRRLPPRRLAAKDVTGSMPHAAAAAAARRAAAPPKPEVARLPTVEGWVLRDVANGGALIESRRGMYEVYAGDPIPGPRPRRRHSQAGRPLGGRDQQGPDRRALTARHMQTRRRFTAT